MYVILVGNDNTLTSTKKECIMQRSKLVDSLWFLVDPDYKRLNMEDFTVKLEYVLPVSRKYKTEILTLDEERYEGFLKYVLPIDTDITSEAGDVELQLTFICAEIDYDGNPVQRVRKTSTCIIKITPITAWSNLIPDSALDVLDQRIIKMDSQIKELNDIAETISVDKADNIEYDDYVLQLTANGRRIGNAIDMSDTVAIDNENSEDVETKVVVF